MEKPEEITIDELEADFYTGAAAIIKANLEDHLGNYALITHAIRYRLKGLSAQFIEDSIDDYKWRIEIYEKVTYNQMVYQFWKALKVESFYKDQDFLRGGEDGISSAS